MVQQLLSHFLFSSITSFIMLNSYKKKTHPCMLNVGIVLISSLMLSSYFSGYTMCTVSKKVEKKSFVKGTAKADSNPQVQ